MPSEKVMRVARLQLIGGLAAMVLGALFIFYGIAFSALHRQGLAVVTTAIFILVAALVNWGLYRTQRSRARRMDLAGRTGELGALWTPWSMYLWGQSATGPQSRRSSPFFLGPTYVGALMFLGPVANSIVRMFYDSGLTCDDAPSSLVGDGIHAVIHRPIGDFAICNGNPVSVLLAGRFEHCRAHTLQTQTG
jgi:hypothetical protein